MGRPRKAQVEGAAVINEPVAKERKAALAAKDGFSVHVERFKTEHPDKWNEVRNGPFYYGLEVMAECLRDA